MMVEMWAPFAVVDLVKMTVEKKVVSWVELLVVLWVGEKVVEKAA